MSKSDFMTELEKMFEKDCDELSKLDIPQYEVSDEFKKKMERLIKYQRKPYFRLICTAGRRAACIIAAVIILSVSSLSATGAYKTIYNFLVNTFSDHNHVHYNSGDSDDYPKTIEKEYLIADMPEEFVLTDYDSNADSIVSLYYNDDKYVLFEQCTKDSYSYNFDNQNSTVEYYTDENGQDYIIYKWESDVIVFWDNGDYIFQISGNLDKESVLDLCKSVTVKR